MNEQIAFYPCERCRAPMPVVNVIWTLGEGEEKAFKAYYCAAHGYFDKKLTEALWEK